MEGSALGGGHQAAGEDAGGEQGEAQDTRP